MKRVNDVLHWFEQDALNIILLLLPNIILIMAVLFQGLDATYVILTYWAESAVIGFYTLPRIGFAGGRIRRLTGPVYNFFNVFTMGFFVVHFGIFMLVHLIFILAYMSSIDNTPFSWNIDVLFAPVLSVVALFVSHGVEFGRALKNRELEAQEPQTVMFKPYSRIIIMHFIIILGFFVLRWIGLTMVLLSVLIILKSIVDMALAWRRRAATGS